MNLQWVLLIVIHGAHKIYDTIWNIFIEMIMFSIMKNGNIWIIVLHENKWDILLTGMTLSGTHCIIIHGTECCY